MRILRKILYRSFIIDKLLESFGFVLRGSDATNIESKFDSSDIDSISKIPTYHSINKKSKHKLELVLSQKITSPTIVGSSEKINFTRFPDYVLYIDSKPHCVLDAKSPNVSINTQSKNERQAFYYTINPEIKAPYYTLCNGKYFVLL